MQISIPFPYDFSANTYPQLKSYLKQLELSVHHAQKAVESAEKDGVELSEDASISFSHHMLEEVLANQSNEDMKNLAINFFEELQRIELTLNLV
jgi:hypothetical protein